MPLPRLIVTLSPSTDVHLALNACSIIPLVRVHSGPLSPSGPHAGSLRVQPSAITTSLGRRTALITSSHFLMSRARTSSILSYSGPEHFCICPSYISSLTINIFADLWKFGELIDRRFHHVCSMVPTLLIFLLCRVHFRPKGVFARID